MQQQPSDSPANHPPQPQGQGRPQEEQEQGQQQELRSEAAVSNVFDDGGHVHADAAASRSLGEQRHDGLWALDEAEGVGLGPGEEHEEEMDSEQGDDCVQDSGDFICE